MQDFSHQQYVGQYEIIYMFYVPTILQITITFVSSMEELNQRKDEATVLLPFSNIYIKNQGKASWYEKNQDPATPAPPKSIKGFFHQHPVDWRFDKRLEDPLPSPRSLCFPHSRTNLAGESVQPGLLKSQDFFRSKYLFNRCFRSGSCFYVVGSI